MDAQRQKKKKKDIICNGKNCLNLQTDKKCSFVQPLLNKPPLPKLNQTNGQTQIFLSLK